MQPRTLLGAVVALWPSLVLAQTTPYISITSTVGPLTGIHLGVEASVQVAHITDGATQEFYPPSGLPADSGTLLNVDGLLYAPDFNQHTDGSATGSIGPFTPFTPVSQTVMPGAGTPQSPYSVETIVSAGTTGVRLRHLDRYVVGEESYRTDVELTNTGTLARNLILYRAADCFLGGSDSGFGVVDALTGAVGCSQNANNSPPGRIEQWLPISPGSTYYQARYSEVWTWISTGQPFPDTCACTTQIDNGGGISWVIVLQPGETVTRSHITTFSPLGSLPLSLAKSADTATTTVGGTNGYTVIVDNRNPFGVPVTSVTDTLPAGFTYLPGSTTGAVTTDPQISGQMLTWTGTITVPGQGAAMFHFLVQVSTSTGSYYNNASASALGGITVSPTGDTALVEVVPEPPAQDAGVTIDAGGGGDGGSMGGDGGSMGGDGGSMGGDSGAGDDDAAAVSDDAAPMADDAAAVGDDAAPMADDATASADAMGSRDVSTTAPDATARADSGVVLGGDEGCSCGISSRPMDSAPWALGLVALAWARRRRRR